MVTKEYFCEDINFFKTKVIDGNIKMPSTGSTQKRINSTKILLSLFRKEIEWWFNLLENSDIKSLDSHNYTSNLQTWYPVKGKLKLKCL